MIALYSEVASILPLSCSSASTFVLGNWLGGFPTPETETKLLTYCIGEVRCLHSNWRFYAIERM